MSLHLLEAPLDLRALHRWAARRGLDARGPLDEGQALHHLLGEVFGPAVLQPFRLLVAPRARRGTIYGYAAQEAAALADLAERTAGPSQREVLTPAALRSVPRPPETWRTGQRIGFDLRMRPVVRLAAPRAGRDKTFAKGAEIDAFLVEALRTAAPRPRETVYLDWLAKRLATAAELEPDATRIAALRRSRVARGGRLLDGPDVTVHGTLRVTDPAAFVVALAGGVGRHKAYGYGMLLLRPPQRAG